MKNVLITLSILLICCTVTGQGKIEILINNEVQNNSQTISVSNPDDKIELRIYTPQKNFLIDSLKSEGCGEKTVIKKRFIIFRSRQQQQQQQQQTTDNRYVNKKYDAVTYQKALYKANYYSFSFQVKEVTGCIGKFFFLKPIFDDKKSDLEQFKGYLKKYKFIYIL